MNFKYLSLIFLLTSFLLNAECLQANSLPTNSTTQSSTSSPLQSSNDNFTHVINQDSPISKVIVVAMGGFLGWIFVQCVGLYILRQKLISYLLVVINAYLSSYQDIIKWINAVKSKTLKVDHIINTAAKFTQDDFSDLKSVRDNCFKLLSKSELLIYIKIVNRMWETEALLNGLCSSLTEYKRNNTVLKVSDVEYLNCKIDRILSYISLFPANISKLNQLPIDLKGVQGAEVLVSFNSAMKPARPQK